MKGTYIGLLIVCLVELVRGHGRLVKPASRVSLWRFPAMVALATQQGKKPEADYNDNGKNCGGYTIQWFLNGGKCGICGDRFDSFRPQEAPEGPYALGIIVESYTAGEIIDVSVELTANHKGWFQFRLCPVVPPALDATQSCLDKNLLQLADGSGTKFFVDSAFNQSTKLRLPAGLTCERCVLQWKYHAGNNWGFDPVTGRGCLGCDPKQEEFYACADVKIMPDSNVVTKRTTTTAAITTRRMATTERSKCLGAGSLKNSADVAMRCIQACASGCCPPQLCNDACRPTA